MSLKDLRILLVEDDPIIAEHLCQLLEFEGAKVIGRAHNGLRALDLLHTYTPEFVICDIHLGTGMSGTDVAEVIHQKYDIPYIFLTSFDDEGTMEQAQQHSPYGYIVKPFHDRTLISTIKIAVGNHQKKTRSGQLSRTNIEEKINASISDQEYSILSALVAGRSYQQIAESQFLSKDTIKYHAGKLYNKCGIKNRSALAARLL